MRKVQNEKNNVVLIGFMGCGKTSVGIRLSYMMKRGMQDTDKLIEMHEGRSINEIFADDGEEYFRTCETNLLRRIAEDLHEQILCVGGGTVIRAENRELLRRIGTVVWLKVSPQTVYERLKDDTTRPLLKGPDPYGTICGLMRERDEMYRETANVILEADGMDTGSVAEKIMEDLK